MQKTNFKTRLLALLTAVFMVIVSMPFAAFADAQDDQVVNLIYWDEESNQKVCEYEGTEGLVVDASKTYLTNEDVQSKMSNGYTFYSDIATATYQINGGWCRIGVKPVPAPTTKTIKINYYSESEGKQVAEVEMKVAADATSVNTSELTAPKGYTINETGDLQIRDGYVYVAVSKVEVPTTKTIKINYYSESEEKQIAEVEMTVAADATYVNTSKLTAPEGYKLVLSGDLAIRDGYVYAAVNKIGSKTVKINYYSEAEEKQIAEVEMTVAPDATCVNTSKLTAPTGYELVEVGDLPIRDGYVYAAVRKVSTTTIKISYVDEATDKEVGTEDLVVNQGNTVVNFNVLKSVPAGYELCEVGDFYVGNGSAKVMVRKTKSNNGSSSSTSSSSSNKTTTASSKAEQKVVKAAAAPANTTKVLPKTGASNVAPLLGGSLAVVALLMGYGVYGLVLRKKD